MASWKYYKSLMKGVPMPVIEAEPQYGYYRAYAGQEDGRKRYLPLGIWPADNSETPVLVVEHNGKRLSFEIEKARVCRLWVSASKSPCSREDYVAYLSTGKWPTEVDEVSSPAAHEALITEEFEATTVVVGLDIAGDGNSPDRNGIAVASPTALPSPAVGHNSGANGDDIAKLSEGILEDAAFITDFYKTNNVSTQTEADIAEDRRKRISEAAKAANIKRREEKQPLERQLEAIDAKWNPIIKAANDAAAFAKTKADLWVASETARLRKEREDEARRAAEVAAEAARKAREAEIERQRLAKAAEPATSEPTDEELPFDLPDPPPAQAVMPVIETPRVLIGTQGHRRGMRAAPATATIVDLAKAAVYLAEIQHPDLIALVQKVGNAAAKSKTQLPGVVMSWEEQKQGAA